MNKPDDFGADYFERGRACGVSCYENYRWLPELTVPMVRAIASQLGIHKPDTILDYGCAKGYVVKAFRSLGYQAFGCDISEYAIDAADEDTREHLCLLGPTRALPMRPGGRAWDWVLAKDVLEHLTEAEIAFALGEMSACASNVFAVVPLGDGERFTIPDMELDATHVTRQPLAWWVEQFYRRGFQHVDAFHEMRGVKENWTTQWPNGNGFLVAR